MADLQLLYRSLGFNSVQSYIQSGNLVFRSDLTDCNQIAKSIQLEIERIYSFKVPVFILTARGLKKVLLQNPFLKQPDKDPAFFHISFLDKIPDPEKLQLLPLNDKGSDQWVVRDRAIYLYCPNGYGNTKLNNTYLENKLKCQATTRNWNTSNRLLELAEATY